MLPNIPKSKDGYDAGSRISAREAKVATYSEGGHSCEGK